MRERFTPAETYLKGSRMPVINTVSDFFRSDNTNSATFVHAALEIQGRQEISPSDIWQIAELPCSTGMETWSLAAGLAVQGIANYKIDAYDINPHVLAVASKSSVEPYELTADELKTALQNWRLPDTCMDLFEIVDKEHIAPGPELRTHVDFHELDVRKGTIPAADVIIMNKFLLYFTSSKRLMKNIIRNSVSELLSGGVFTASHIPDKPNVPRVLGRHGLVPDDVLNGRHAPFALHYNKTSPVFYHK